MADPQITNSPSTGPSKSYTGFLFDTVATVFSQPITNQPGPFIPGVVNYAPSFALLTAASATGSGFQVAGGNYLLSVGGTFGGATVTVTSVFNGVTTTLATLTAAPAAPLAVLLPSGAVVTAAITNATAGTTSINAMLGGTSNAPLPADGSVIQVTGTAVGVLTNTTYTTGVIPTAGFQSAGIQVPTGVGVAAVEETNDPINGPWTSIYQGIASGSTGIIATGYQISNAFLSTVFPLNYSYIRVRLTSYTSGTFTANISLKTSPVPYPTQGPATYNSALVSGLATGAVVQIGVDQRAHMKISAAGSSDPLTGIVPTLQQSGTSLVGKATAGNSFGAYAVALVAPTAQQYLVCVNLAAVPTSGATITPQEVIPFNGSVVGSTASVSYGEGPPDNYTAGIIWLITTSLTTYTPGTATFIKARVR